MRLDGKREVGRLAGGPCVSGMHLNFRLVTARQSWLVGEVTRAVCDSSVDHRLLFLFFNKEEPMEGNTEIYGNRTYWAFSFASSSSSLQGLTDGPVRPSERVVFLVNGLFTLCT